MNKKKVYNNDVMENKKCDGPGSGTTLAGVAIVSIPSAGRSAGRLAMAVEAYKPKPTFTN